MQGIDTYCQTAPILRQLRKRLRHLEENLVKLNPAYSLKRTSLLRSSDQFSLRSVYGFLRKKLAIVFYEENGSVFTRKILSMQKKLEKQDSKLESETFNLRWSKNQSPR